MTPYSQDIPRSHWATASDYFELLKPRVMALVIFTALVGMLIAPAQIHPVIGFAALLAIAMGAGASGALNMWIEADIDRQMTRTRGRPIPTGRIAPGAVLGFGTTLAVAAVTTMGLMVNLWAGALLTFTIFFYVVIYTIWLKPRTPENIVIGGAAGALPPVVAWSAVTGAPGIEAWIPFLIIFLWTPPHFWALALFNEGDYERVGLPMLPIVKGETVTRRRILIYALILAPVGVLPWFAGIAGPVYAATAALMGSAFAFGAFRLWRRKDEDSAKRLFGFSIIYLFSLFAVMGGEALLSGVR